jgi:hypothetical protein
MMRSLPLFFSWAHNSSESSILSQVSVPFVLLATTRKASIPSQVCPHHQQSNPLISSFRSVRAGRSTAFGRLNKATAAHLRMRQHIIRTARTLGIFSTADLQVSPMAWPFLSPVERERNEGSRMILC